MKVKQLCIHTPKYNYEVEGCVLVIEDSDEGVTVLEREGNVVSIHAPSFEEALQLLGESDKILTFTQEDK